MAFRERRHVSAVFFDLEGAYGATWSYGILLQAFNCAIHGLWTVFYATY